MENFPLLSALGIKVDFTNGIKITVPAGCPEFEYRFSDADTGELYDEGTRRGYPDIVSYMCTVRKFYVRWRVELFQTHKRIFDHTFDANGQTVFFNQTGALGDSIAWMPAIFAFIAKWNCKGIVRMGHDYIPMFEKAYPDIQFVDKDVDATEIENGCYAAYALGVFGYGNIMYERMDFRHNNLIRHADMILGVDSMMKPPMLFKTQSPEKPRKKKYVCIATRASRKCKHWHYPDGWERITAYLVGRGFDVVCIDADDQCMPPNAIDNTGRKPLTERVDMISKSALLVGLPSGLSWMAWACGVPVVMISGLTDSYVEFATPYRVSPPPGVCHGCWRDGNLRDRKRFDSCYRDKDNECTRSITPDMVIEQINKIIGGEL